MIKKKKKKSKKMNKKSPNYLVCFMGFYHRHTVLRSWPAEFSNMLTRYRLSFRYNLIWHYWLSERMRSFINILIVWI